MSSTLEIKDLHVSIEDKEILKGVNLTINTTTKYMQLWGQMEQVNQHYHQQLWGILAMKSRKGSVIRRREYLRIRS